MAHRAHRHPPITRLAAAVAASIFVAGCGNTSPTGPEFIVGPSESVALSGNSTLVFQGPEALGEHRPRVEQVVKDALAAASQQIPLTGITIIIDAPSTDNVIPEIGIGGRADAGTIRMSINTARGVWVASIETHLFALLAHEMHHVARFRAIGFYDNLLDGMISEGLADQFAVALANITPPMWSVALIGAELADWRERARPEWFNGGYDHGAWFFGTTSQIPRWAGYSIGFAMSGDYIAADASRSAAGLYAEPAASFVDE